MHCMKVCAIFSPVPSRFGSSEMGELRSMTQSIASGGMVVAGLCAMIAVGSVLSPAPASAQGYSAWRTIQYGDAVGAQTDYSDGSEIVLAAVNGELHLVLQDPSWHLPRG